MENKKENKINKDNISMVELAIHKPKEVVETAGRKAWVDFGEDDSYFQYIIDRFNFSTTNKTLITAISRMIYGGGLTAKDASSHPESYAQMLGLFKKRDVRRIVNDLKMFGMFSYQVVYSKDHSKIVKVKHIPVDKLRAEKLGDDDTEVQGYYYSWDWDRNYIRKNKPQRIPAFGTSKEGLEVIVVKPYTSGTFYYNAPDYSGGLTYAEIEEEIADYHVTNIQQGFSPTTLINFNNGQITSEEGKAQMAKKVENKLTGSKGKKVLISYNDSKENETTFETFSISDADKQYQFLSDESRTQLMVAHGVTSGMLFGLNTANGFSSNADEIKNASIYMNNTVIEPFQELILDSFDEVLAFNEISLDLAFKSVQPWESEDVNNNEETNTEE